MRGCKRVPLILYDQPLNYLKNINCAKYETFQFQPMHDIANHIQHILNEIPEHIDKKKRQKFIDALTISYTNKTIKTCCDHRLTLVKVLLQLDNRLPYQCYIILHTLAEIQHIV